MSQRAITTTVNGEPVQVLAGPTQTLLDLLRDGLGLTGSKEGCGSGDCGACSVLLDGRLVCACLVLAPEADGRRVDTVEGLARDGRLSVLQQQFVQHAALQCGFCTPGLLMAAQALLDRQLEPSETEIRFALAGNLCRCTGYDKIVRAVQAAAAQLRTEAA